MHHSFMLSFIWFLVKPLWVSWSFQRDTGRRRDSSTCWCRKKMFLWVKHVTEWQQPEPSVKKEMKFPLRKWLFSSWLKRWCWKVMMFTFVVLVFKNYTYSTWLASVLRRAELLTQTNLGVHTLVCSIIYWFSNFFCCSVIKQIFVNSWPWETIREHNRHGSSSHAVDSFNNHTKKYIFTNC